MVIGISVVLHVIVWSEERKRQRLETRGIYSMWVTNIQRPQRSNSTLLLYYNWWLRTCISQKLLWQTNKDEDIAALTFRNACGSVVLLCASSGLMHINQVNNSIDQGDSTLAQLWLSGAFPVEPCTVGANLLNPIISLQDGLTAPTLDLSQHTFYGSRCRFICVISCNTEAAAERTLLAAIMGT